MVIHAYSKLSKPKQRCVMGVGMYIYAQLVQTKKSSAPAA